MKTCLSLFALLIILTGSLPAQHQMVKGFVFEDQNGNGRMDEGEKGIFGVAVSNQRQVVQTDIRGYYELPAYKPMIVFVSKPSGYEYLHDQNYLPRFYYIHHPVGSPAGLKYKGVEPSGPLPAPVNFPLIKTQVQNEFNALVVGDPQLRDASEAGYFRDDIVAEMLGRDARFYLALGDIMYDNLGYYDPYNRSVAQLGITAYNVSGNHDMNYDVEHDSLALQTFRRVYGPEYYSFNYGHVHFVILDVVEYKGYDTENQKNGGYRGYLTPKQLEWLENDLRFVPEDNLIVLAMHIPIHTRYSESAGVNLVNRESLFRLLENRKQILALSAHMHFIEHFTFGDEAGWMNPGSFYSINPGAGCGAWWTGQKDGRGIPESYCMDGTPNGFYTFHFKGNQFNYQFIPANEPEKGQMRISVPNGVITQNQADTLKVLANIFVADDKSDVYMQIDRYPRMNMEHTPGTDPFIRQYLHTHAEHYPDWINRPALTRHMWSAPLPEDLMPGTHTIRISARDSKGNLYSGVRIFEVSGR